MRLIFFMIMLLAGLLLWTPDSSFDHLKAFYETPQSELVPTPESLIFAEDNPASLEPAPTVVLIHGMGSSLQTWDEWTRLLKPHARVLRFDLPGLGLSSAPASKDYSDQAELKRLEQFLARKKVEHFILAGHDLGARLAWRYTSLHPENVTHLVLLSPEGFTQQTVDAFKKQMEGADGTLLNVPSLNAPLLNSPSLNVPLYNTPFYLELMRFTLPKWLVKIWLESAYADPSLITEQTLARYHDMLLAPGVRSHLIERLSQSKAMDFSAPQEGFTTPTLLIWGENDLITPLSQLDVYQHLLPLAKTWVLSNTGHLIQEENAPESIKAFLAFIKNPQSSEFESRPGNSTSAKPN